MFKGANALVQHLNSDRFAIRGAVTAIRNAFMQPNQQHLLAAAGAERRASARVRLHVPLRVTAAIVDQVEEHVQIADGPSIDAVGRDISLGGIGLTHGAPLPSDRAIVQFEMPGDDPIWLAVGVVWSNRSADGQWISGVKILGLTDPTGR